MKSKYIASFACATAMLSAGCSWYPYTANNYNNLPTNGVVTTAQMQVEARILGSLVALNNNEIAAASLAQRKTSNMAVKNYANWMYRVHSQNLQATENLSRQIGILPQTGPIAAMLQRKGREEMAMLNRLNNNAFDRAYIAAMVKDHAAALQLIQKLLSLTTNPQIKRHLEMTRGHVMEHLKQAQMIQQQLPPS